MDTEQLLRLAIEEEGVAYVVGSGFHADGGGKNTMRLNFSYPSEQDIAEGIKRLGTLVKKRAPTEVTAP
jgi:DNA-binding transcriptional MocR family regulator